MSIQAPMFLLCRRTLLVAVLVLVATASSAAAQDPLAAFRTYVEASPPDVFCTVYGESPVCKALATGTVDYVRTTPAEVVCASGAAAGPVCAANAALTSRVRVLEDAYSDARFVVTTIRSVARENDRLRKAARRSIVTRIRALPADDVWPLVAVIASRLSRAGEPYGASRFVNRDQYSDYTSWTITRSVFHFGG